MELRAWVNVETYQKHDPPFHDLDFTEATALLKAPATKPNRTGLITRIVELSRLNAIRSLHQRGYDNLRFAKLIDDACLKYPNTIEFRVAVFFALLSIGHYHNGLEGLKQIADSEVPRNHANVITVAVNNWSELVRSFAFWVHDTRPRSIDFIGISRNWLKKHRPKGALAADPIAFMGLPDRSFTHVQLKNLPIGDTRLDLIGKMRMDSVKVLVEDYWGSLGLGVFSSFRVLLDDPNQQNMDVSSLPPPDIHMSLDKERLSLSARTSMVQWRAGVACLTWLLGILSSNGALSSLKMRHFSPLSSDYTGSIKISSSNLIIFNANATQASSRCWVQLVNSGYIGIHQDHEVNFCGSTRERFLGKGLKMPFDLLLHISGVEHMIEVDKTPILCGFQTALIPIRRYPDGSVQWHFITKPSDESFRWFLHHPDFLRSLPAERLRNVNRLDDLKATAYVGWSSSSVQIVLGTKDPPTNLARSRLPQARHRYRATGFDLQAAVQITPLFGVGPLFGITKKYNNEVLQLRFTPSENSYGLIDQLYSKQVILYDEGRKTAFLCKLINLVLLLVRGYLRDNHYQYDVDIFKFPAPIEDSQPYIRTLQNMVVHGSLELSFGDIFKIVTLRYSAANASIPQTLRNSKIFGFELADLMATNDGFCARELSINCGVEAWSAIAETTDIVFASQVGDVITIADASQKPPCLQQPLSGCNILVCPFQLLKRHFDFIENNCYRQKGRTDIYWRVTGNPFDCQPTISGRECDARECWRDRLQRVRHRERFVNALLRIRTAVVTVPFPMDRDGAICFGSLSPNVRKAVQGGHIQADRSMRSWGKEILQIGTRSLQSSV
jgi:hypothetical protein